MFETKTQKENLRTLILSHEHAIDRWRDRLDEIRDTDPQALLVRSQIEFLILNAENFKYGHESTLASAEEAERYMAEYPASSHPQIIYPAPAMAPNPYANFKPHPDIKLDDVAYTRMYVNKRNPVCGLLVYVMSDGRLVDPVDARDWPTPKADEWDLKTEVAGAQ